MPIHIGKSGEWPLDYDKRAAFPHTAPTLGE